jgi:fatty acid desaturase
VTLGLGRPDYLRGQRHVHAIRVDTYITFVAAGLLAWGSLVSDGVRWAWLLPLSIYICIAFPFFHTFEHAQAEDSALSGETWNQINIGRTVVLHPAISWFLWHSNYHSVHHMYPRVPADNLPFVQQTMVRVQNPSTVFRGFRHFWYSTWANVPTRSFKHSQSSARSHAILGHRVEAVDMSSAVQSEIGDS